MAPATKKESFITLGPERILEKNIMKHISMVSYWPYSQILEKPEFIILPGQTLLFN